MRVERIGSATLYCGDAREIVPTLIGVDALVTDPPYGIGFDYFTYDDTRNNLRDLIATVVVPSILATKRAVITPGQTQVWMYPPAAWIAAVQWDTTGTFGHCGYSQWMPAMIYGKDVAGFGRNGSGVLKSDVIRFTGGAGVGFQRSKAEKAHTCPKPLNVMEGLVARFTDAGETVLDPFLGSGTTGVACATLGRPFVGIEIDPRYFDLACERIEAAQRQADLFVTPATLDAAYQRSMFDETPA